MPNKHPFGTIIPLAVFCVINLLFIVKYSSRISWLPTLIFSLVYIAFCSMVIPCVRKIPNRFLARRNAFLIIGLFILASLTALWLLKPETLRVDRWGVITSFLDDLFLGKYPYDAKSNLGNPPGPFPFYYIIALPFYLVNGIGLLTLTALAVFFAFLNKKSTDDRTFFLQTILLAASPAMAWEIMVRSTIFVNFSLVILYAFWLEKSVLSKEPRRVALPGLVGGLLLSTRAIAAIPVVCYLSYALLRKKDVAGYFRMCAAMAAGFCITFVPLLFWGWDSFIRQNPIVLQASFVPPVITVCFLFISFSSGFFLKDFNGWLRFCGVLVFLIVATSMILTLFDTGWNRALFGSEFDISYFIFCIPFIIASLQDREPCRAKKRM
jgi:hypothetical protein